MTRVLMIFAFALTLGLPLCSLAEVDKDDVRGLVEERLERRGIELGVNPANMSIAEIGEGVVKTSITDNRNVYEDDFSSLQGDDPILRRFKAEWMAYARGVGAIAEFMKTSVVTEPNPASNEKRTKRIVKKASHKLSGLRIVEKRVSVDDNECRAAVAVVCAPKQLEPIDLSVSQYMEELCAVLKNNENRGVLHMRVFCDRSGNVWQIGSVPCWSGSKRGREIAYKIASCADSIQVDVSKKIKLTSDSDISFSAERIRIRPTQALPEMMSDDVEWFSFDDTDGVHYVACAIRVRKLAQDEENKSDE